MVDDDSILYQTPGLTIAFDPEAATLVPYGPAERADGNRNYGWTDLRGRPDLADTIVEGAKSEGLKRMLRATADAGSDVFSIACECALFPGPGPEWPAWQVGGFFDISFGDADRASNRDELVALAHDVAGRLQFESGHFCTFEFIVRPLKSWFGQQDCFELELKPFGWGAEQATAWRAFDAAAGAVAGALEQRRGAN